MKSFRQSTNPLLMLLLALSFLTVGCSSDSKDSDDDVPSITVTEEDGSTSVDADVLDDILDALPKDAISEDERAGLVFMREEEKLARDVYIYLFAQWGQKVFDNISESEQSHTDAVLALLDRYDIPDPVGSNAEGVFEDSYLQGLYDSLIASGSASLLDGLYAGAEIEELDIIDIQRLADEVVGNEDIVIVYENLIKGSRNHLRAFVSNIEKQAVIYQPRHLTQDAYDAIINEDFETD